MMAKKDFYAGYYRQGKKENWGWLVGHFMDNAQKSSHLEVKYWEFKAGEPTNHPPKKLTVVECTMILQGKTKGFIGNENITLSEGEYVVIPPGVPNNLNMETIDDVQGITIKSPSVANSKLPI